jgi:alkyldihydroxyacetonephosphate synthase
MAVERDKTNWCGWGWQSMRYDFHGHRPHFLRWIGGQLGIDALATSTPPVAMDSFVLPAIRLDDADLAELAAAAGGQGALQTDHKSRVLHALGRSLPDVFRLRRGEVTAAPDAVVLPADEAAVIAVLQLCRRRDWAVVPFGGGSSVVGGVEPTDPKGRPVVTLDTTRLDRMIAFRPEDQCATFGAGIYGPDLEAALAAKGWELGHVPQSFEFSTLGGWIAARSSGQQSNQYGDIVDLLVSCRMVTPEGVIATWDGPVSAAGPDLDPFLAGTEGTFGVITEATVRIHPKPATHRIQAVLFPSFAEGTAALAAIVAAGLRMSYMRLSDEVETETYLKMSGPKRVQDMGLSALRLLGYGDLRCVALVGTEGTADTVDREVAEAVAIAKKHRGLSLGASPAKNWHRDRYLHPYMRDDLLDAGIATETHETAVPWSRVAAVREDVRASIMAAAAAQGRKAHVFAHLSHSYATGTCIYFVLMYAVDAADPLGQWRPIKAAICDAVVRHGGTISHHHGVGLDHKAWLIHEKGPMGLRMIAAARRAVDPTGICNPGKLIDL